MPIQAQKDCLEHLFTTCVENSKQPVYYIYGSPNIGKSTVAELLAALLCQTGKPVNLVTCTTAAGKKIQTDHFSNAASWFVKQEGYLIFDQLNLTNYDLEMGLLFSKIKHKYSTDRMPVFVFGSGHYPPSITLQMSRGEHIQCISMEIQEHEIIPLVNHLGITKEDCPELEKIGMEEIANLVYQCTKHIGHIVCHVIQLLQSQNLAHFTGNTLTEILFPLAKNIEMHIDNAEAACVRSIYSSYLDPKFASPVPYIPQDVILGMIYVKNKQSEDSIDCNAINIFFNCLRLTSQPTATSGAVPGVSPKKPRSPRQSTPSSVSVASTSGKTPFSTLKNPVFCVMNGQIIANVEKSFSGTDCRSMVTMRETYRVFLMYGGSISGGLFEQLILRLCEEMKSGSVEPPFALIPAGVKLQLIPCDKFESCTTSDDIVAAARMDVLETAKRNANDPDIYIMCYLQKNFVGWDFAVIKKTCSSTTKMTYKWAELSLYQASINVQNHKQDTMLSKYLEIKSKVPKDCQVNTYFLAPVGEQYTILYGDHLYGNKSDGPPYKTVRFDLGYYIDVMKPVGYCG